MHITALTFTFTRLMNASSSDTVHLQIRKHGDDTKNLPKKFLPRVKASCVLDGTEQDEP